MKKTILILLCVIMALPLFAGGGRQSGSASGASELVWYVGGNGPQPDTPAVLAEANRYLAEKLNVRLNIIETDWGNYEQKMQMVTASREVYDMCFTANWINNFYTNVSRNAYLELDDLINRHAPGLKADMPSNGWDAAKVGGRIYAVPNQQIWAGTNALFVGKSYLDRYNINPASINDLSAVESLLALIKRDNPNMYPLACCSFDNPFVNLWLNMGLDLLSGSNIPGAVLLNDSSLKVINQYELPQVQAMFRLMRQWYQRGYMRPDAATVSDYVPDIIAGRHALDISGTIKPGVEIEAQNGWGGREVAAIPMSSTWLTTSGITATMNAISRTSRNPDKAMQFLNLINTDKYLYNLITQGIEGRHYTRIDANYIRPVANSAYNPEADWMYGNQFLAYFKEGQDRNIWDDTKKLNVSARPSPALGFAFDPTPVNTEIAGVNSVTDEYLVNLAVGAVDPDTVLPVFLERLRSAGSQRIIDEIQRQLDAWKATR